MFDIATMGTSLSWLYRWQPEMVRRLGAAGIRARAYNPATNGGNSAVGIGNIPYVVRLRPQAALLEFSMNDCCTISVAAAEANATTIVKALKAIMPANRIYLMTMNWPVGSGSDAVARASVPSYYASYRALAATLGVGLIDIEPLWVSGYIAGDIPDGLHPTEAASKRITAPAIANRLIADL